MLLKEIFLLNKDFRNLRVLAGHSGLNREIKSVEIMEVPDGIYWASEGDFLITTGYSVSKGDISLEYIVNHLIDRNSAALAIKLGRFIDEIPESILQLANEHSLPIIAVPSNIPYSSVVNPLIDAMNNEKDELIIEYQYNDFEKEYNNLKNKQYTIKDLNTILEKALDYKVIVISYGESKSKNFSTNIDINLSTTLTKKLEQIDDTNISIIIEDRIYNAFRIINSFKETLGYLIIISDKYLTKTELKIIEKLVPEYSIVFLTETIQGKARYIGIQKFYNDLINGKYTDNELELEENIIYFRISKYLIRRILVIKINSDKNSINIDNMINIFKYNLSKIKSSIEFYEFNENKLTLMIAYEKLINEATDYKVLKEILDTINSIFGENTINIGISKYCKNLKKISYAYDEADFSLTIGSKIDCSKSFYPYNDYMIHHLLFNTKNQSTMDIIYNNTIKRLKDYDNENNTNLLETLIVLSNCDYVIIEAAKALYIHRNTLYKRITKISEILDVNLEKTNDRIITQLALKLEEMK